MFRSGKEPEMLVDELGLRQISDEDVIVELVKKVLDQNKKSVEDYKNGKSNALGFLVGQCIAFPSKGNPKLINKILKDLMRI